MTIHVNQEALSAKLNLAHIGEYIPVVMEQPEYIRKWIIENNFDCTNCHSGCAGGFSFEMEGKSYVKCRGGAFLFDTISMEDISSYKRLLKEEIQTI